MRYSVVACDRQAQTGTSKDGQKGFSSLRISTTQQVERANNLVLCRGLASMVKLYKSMTLKRDKVGLALVHNDADAMV